MAPQRVQVTLSDKTNVDWLFDDDDKDNPQNRTNFVEIQVFGEDAATRSVPERVACDHIQDLRSRNIDFTIVIRQYNTWNRLMISSASYHRIVEAIHPSHYLADLVRAFGVRNDDDTRILHGYRWWKDATINEQDFGYNIRYYQYTGSDEADFWSLRQTGVYHKLNLTTTQSTWMLIQPSSGIMHSQSAMSPTQDSQQKLATIFQVHNDIVRASSDGWLSYIEFLHLKLSKLSEKTLYSRVGGPQPPVDYSIAFIDCQSIEALAINVRRAQNVIESNIAIANGCKTWYRRIASELKQPPETHLIDSFTVQVDEMRGYHNDLAEIVQRCYRISRLLSEILQFRRDETAHEQAKALQALNQAQTRASQQVADLQQQTVKDSRLLKSLTIMASLYLPATTILTFFGSNLVQTRQVGSRGEDLSIVLVREAWLAIVIPAPLILATLLIILWLTKGPSRDLK